MKFDDTDIAIIFVLYDNHSQTTSGIAKKIFNCNNMHELTNKDALVRERLKHMVNQKVVICASETSEYPKLYNVNPECVFCGQGIFKLKVNGDKSIELDFGYFLAITDGKDYVQIQRITEPSADIEIKT